jgi:cytochrome c oxidase subunit IV
MASTTHSHPNYMGIFWVLLVLTVVEVALTFLGLPKLLLGSLLVILAVWKAALVAMYFMHLKFERRTLAMIAVVPFILCLFLILMLLPDIGPA